MMALLTARGVIYVCYVFVALTALFVAVFVALTARGVMYVMYL